MSAALTGGTTRGRTKFENASQLQPTSKPEYIESFHRQFWSPTFSVKGVEVDTQSGHPLVGAVLPYVDGERERVVWGNVTLYTLQDRGVCCVFGTSPSHCVHIAELTVKIDNMQLSEYPFDKQQIKLRFQPALNNNADNFKIIAGLSDSNVRAYATCKHRHRRL